ncbi:MAG: GntR family transcriptional regulator [Faecalimonas sp.]|nr:GntR family transcriptional regulator [Faecalimonas sp.]
MSWRLDKNKPICPQLCEQLSVRIAAGIYEPNAKLPSVRELAVLAGVNPNTVQRAYEVLEQKGMIYTVRNSGTFVSEDNAVAKESVESLRAEKTKEYFLQMETLGFDAKNTKEYVKEWEV